MSFLRGVQRYEETTTSVLHEYGGENHLFDPTAPAQAVFGWDSCRRYGFGQNDHGVSSHFGTKTCRGNAERVEDLGLTGGVKIPRQNARGVPIKFAASMVPRIHLPFQDRGPLGNDGIFQGRYK